MLQKLADHIKACFDRAAEAEELAAKTAKPTLKAEHLEMAKRWMHLARSYEFVESLERFLLDSQKERRTSGGTIYYGSRKPARRMNRRVGWLFPESVIFTESAVSPRKYSLRTPYQR